MTERKIIERLMRATQDLAYWSRELLKVNAAIERSVIAGRAEIRRRSVARKERHHASRDG
jgi:hypothetical protein